MSYKQICDELLEEIVKLSKYVDSNVPSEFSRLYKAVARTGDWLKRHDLPVSKYLAR